MITSAALDLQNQNKVTIENTLTADNDELVQLITRLDHLEKANAEPTTEVKNLENPSRRQNLRIMGLPEDVESN